MSAPLRPPSERERQGALEAFDLRDTPSDRALDEIAELAAEICNTPIAMVTMIDRDRQWVKSSSGFHPGDVARDLTFCGHAILEPTLMMVNDAQLDERFAGNPFVVGKEKLRFYAGAPIRTEEGHALGTLCVLDVAPRELTPFQQRALVTLGHQVIAQLELRRRLRQEAHKRVAAEHSRDRFFDLSVDPMCVLDGRGRFRRCNSAFAKIVGVESHELAEETYTSLLHPDDVEVTIEYGQRLVASQRTEQHVNRYRTKAGIRYIEWTSLFVADERQFYSIARDITEQKALEQQLRQAQKMDAVGQLAGGIAHDFNNILSVITGFAVMAKESLPDGHDARGDLDEVIRAAEGATNLTRQLLTFGRKSPGEAPRTLDLDTLVGEVDKMVRRLIGENIHLTTRGTRGLWPIRADRTQLEQALINLIVNARDAMPRGGRLEIATENVTVDAAMTKRVPELRPGAYVKLRVTDTGTGMSAEIQSRIFEPFFTTKDVGKGTGLGLATVFGTVKAANGHILVHSEVGAGTTFELYLPRTSQTVLGMAPLAKPNARGNETIMLVEDDAAVRQLAARGLARLGYTVVEADSAEAALVKLASSRVQLLLTDVVMPGMTGPELAERLRTDRPGTKVMFMSGYTRNALDGSALERGRAHFIEKPLSLPQLGIALRELLDM